jgi:hypothetical protein
VHEAQRQCLCQAFPIEFWGLSGKWVFPQKSLILIFSRQWLCKSLKS